MNANKSLLLSIALSLLAACVEERDPTSATYDGGSSDDGGMTDGGGTTDDGGGDTDTGTSDGGTSDGGGEVRDCDRDGLIDGIGTDEVIPCGGKLYISERRLPPGDEDEQGLVGRGLFGTEEDWCREGINPSECQEGDYLEGEGFVALTIPASAADGIGHIFVNVRYMPDGECVDSGEQAYWGYITDLVGEDPAACQNPEDEYRVGLLFQFDEDGNIKNPTDCSSAEGANDPGNDDEDDDDTAGTSDGGSDADGDGDVDPGDGGSSDDGDGGSGDGGSDDGDGGDTSDGGSSSDGGGSDGDVTCNVRVSVDGDTTVEGDSSHYTEVYLLPQDSSDNSISTAYWPSGDWSSQSYSSMSEALSYSDGGTDSDTFTFTGTRVASVKLNGAVWGSSGGGGSFLRWLVGSYSDASSASFEVELSCDGDAYEELSCAPSGNDMVCD